MQQVKANDICSNSAHLTDMCPTLQDEPYEQANAVGGFPGPPQRKYDPYSNTSNPGWKDHPNFNYGARPTSLQPPYQARQPIPPHQSSSKPSMSLDEIVKALETNTQQFQQ